LGALLQGSFLKGPLRKNYEGGFGPTVIWAVVGVNKGDKLGLGGN